MWQNQHNLTGIFFFFELWSAFSLFLLILLATRWYGKTPTNFLANTLQSLLKTTDHFKLKISNHLPAWTAGCKVFTRPPSISGNPVISETSLKTDKQNIATVSAEFHFTFYTISKHLPTFVQSLDFQNSENES